MLVWNMDKENNLSIGASGQINMANKLDAVRIRIDAALQIVKGELEDNTLGVDYFGIIFSDTPLSMKIQELTRIIRTIDEVLEVKFIRAETDIKNNKLSFFFEITSIYGSFNYDYGFENIWLNVII